jgi:hypothetical protein
MLDALQTFLRDCPTGAEARAARLQQLSERYSIAVRRHPKFDELVMLKYDQIHSPMAEPVVQACRGIILDESRDWAVVCHSFDKFFNEGEPLAAPIDWNSACVFEKLDGSLIQMYHHAGAWHVATSGTPDAGGQVFDSGISFADLFWKVFHAQGLSLADLDVPECDDERAGSTRDWTRFTFAWELMTPLNRVVVQHKTSRVALIGIRDRVRNVECGVYQGPAKWPKVQAWPANTLADVKVVVEALDPLKQEGFVVVDRNWNRVKIKSPAYIALHHMRGNGNPSPKRALEVWLAGETQEILAAFPEWEPLFGEVEDRFHLLQDSLGHVYAGIKDIPIQKDFALKATKVRCSAALFAVRAGKAASIEAYLRAMPVDRLAELLELKELEPPVYVDL